MGLSNANIARSSSQIHPMRIVSCSEGGIFHASRTVRSGGLVVYPTDTVYGLGCDPRNRRAVKRVFQIKGREKKPLPVLFANLENVRALVEMSPLAENLASRFWPGPLTMVCRLVDHSFDETVALGSGKLGVRIPNEVCSLKLIESCGGALVGTSANRSGERASRSPSEVFQSLGRGFDVILDGGQTRLGRESSVVDVSEDQPKIIREGYLSAADLLSAFTGIS